MLQNVLDVNLLLQWVDLDNNTSNIYFHLTLIIYNNYFSVWISQGS